MVAEAVYGYNQLNHGLLIDSGIYSLLFFGSCHELFLQCGHNLQV